MYIYIGYLVKLNKKLLKNDLNDLNNTIFYQIDENKKN